MSPLPACIFKILNEHNLDVIKTADWVIDLGPEGGDGGGEILAIGTPEDIAANPKSVTGPYLAPLLGMKPVSGGRATKVMASAEAQPKAPAKAKVAPKVAAKRPTALKKAK